MGTRYFGTHNLNTLNNNSVAMSIAEHTDRDRLHLDEYTDDLSKESDDEFGGMENAKEALRKITA